ncbi:LAME_0H04588g1_1 [Lachancea meyersii CBS 8951]|uniref:LAME_0H04588g1_1 n=1 Tax=Lachancea meyersii CBS 8951 TaxID=1266667 RepID=A0A1G4KDY0_9SACH|nr:LAME_0H04588g1_1 [Lachancea meyersii CBS 8951]
MFKIQIRSPGSLGAKSAPTFEDSWKIIENAMAMIHEGRVSELSFEVLFHVVYSLTLRKLGGELYHRIGNALEKKLRNVKASSLNVTSTDLLLEILRAWDNHCESLRLISDVTMYLDKVYCKDNRKPFVYDMGLGHFRDIILKASKDQVHSLMVRQINDARRGAVGTDFETLKALVGMMETLTDSNDTYYITEFEPFLLEKTRKFYKTFIDSYSGEIISYPREVQTLIEKEQEVDSKFLNQDVSIKIAKVVESILISENMHFVAERVTPQLLENNKFSDLKLLFALCHAPTDNKKLWKQCSQYISHEGISITEDFSLKKRAQVAVKWITEILELKTKYENLFKSVAEGESTDLKAVNEAFSIILAQNGKRNAEYLAVYIDFMLRSPSVAEDSMRVKLEEAIAIFKFLREKDVFEKVYQQQLSKRLLQQRSSLKLEKHLVNRMKEEVGRSFALKPEGMFRDMSISQTNNSKFQQSYQVPYAFDISVLTSACWPFQQTSSEKEVVLPASLESLKLDYENYYMKSYNGRVLSWAYHLGSLDVGFQFKKSYHVITMPVYAAIIFMLFEDHEEFSMQEIKDLTNIPEHELIRNLLTIAIAPKTRLLKKQPMNKKILPSDRFRINYSFSAPTTKVKVLAVLTKPESDTQPSSRSNDVAQDLTNERKRCVEAAIVRTLKSSQRMYFDPLFELVREAVAVRFQLDPGLFHKSVDKLVEREYIQRDPDDGTFLHYLA